MDAKDAVEELPDCAEYHPLSELRNKVGCYPNITAQHLATASRLREMIEENDLISAFHRADPDETEFLKLLRFLRARKWDPKNALDMIIADLEWREDDDRFETRWDSAQELLEGVDLNKLYRYYPTWIQGHDKQFRPISYRQFGRFEVWHILEFTTLEKVMRFHVWEMEQILRCMHQNSRVCGHNIETFVVVVDVAGWSLRLTTGDAMALARGMANTDSDHYPERLGVMLLINAPSVLSFAWRIIQTFLDDVQKAKIRILGSPSEWQPVLFDLVDRDQVPLMYGGLAPDPTPGTAFASMNPPAESAPVLRRRATRAARAASVALEGLGGSGAGGSSDNLAGSALAASGGKSKSKGGGGGAVDDSASTKSGGSKAGGSRSGDKNKAKGAKDSKGGKGGSGGKQSAQQYPWYHNICQVPLCKDGDDDFDFIVHFNSTPGDRRPVIETLSERQAVDMSTQTDDKWFAEAAGSAGGRGAAGRGLGCQCAVM